METWQTFHDAAVLIGQCVPPRLSVLPTHVHLGVLLQGGRRVIPVAQGREGYNDVCGLQVVNNWTVVKEQSKWPGQHEDAEWDCIFSFRSVLLLTKILYYFIYFYIFYLYFLCIFVLFYYCQIAIFLLILIISTSILIYLFFRLEILYFVSIKFFFVKRHEECWIWCYIN